MQRSYRWFAMAGLVLALGCPGGEKDTEQEVSTDKAQEGPAPQDTTERVLVQVVIHGLAAFKLERASGTLVGLGAYLPKVSSPPHELLLQRGTVGGGKRKWENVTEDDNGDPLYIGGRKIFVHMDEPLGEVSGASIGDYPADASEAADAGWLLRAQEIDDPTSFDPASASTHVIFKNGVLETCALVFPPKMFGTRDQVCKTRVDNDKHVERSTSEIMVIRGWVLKSEGVVKIDLVSLTDETDVQTVTIPVTGGDPVVWRGDTYNDVINIGIANRYQGTGRDMKSDHANHLKDLFIGETRSWALDSPDCLPQQNCTCKADLQPACWEYFEEMFANSPGGYDRPICPLIGWNQ